MTPKFDYQCVDCGHIEKDIPTPNGDEGRSLPFLPWGDG